jgi:predicted metalloprotease
MRWKGMRESDNVEDRRGSGRRLALGGGLGTLVLVLIVILLGGDPQTLLQVPGAGDAETAQSETGVAETGNASEDELAKFVSVVLADTEDVWHELFLKDGGRYREPKLVLFRDQVRSACGFADAAVGPFYCPADEKVYIDLGFYGELSRRFGAPGDFAQAYVIAHEIGHHVQNLLGVSERVQAMRERAGEAQSNDLSVRMELQADFLAGVWAHHAQRTRQILETGDVEEGLRAAAAIGDDRLQMRAKGYVVPDSFTHGTSAQRVRWFRKGLETGDMDQGNTFAVAEP